MTQHRLFKAAFAGILLAAIPVASTSATVSPVPTPVAAATTAQHLANLKAKGTTEIDRRLANLNSALTKLAASNSLSAADKAALTKTVNDEIAGLTALKTKLAAETVIATARTEVASVVADYRVYALLLPKTRMVASADRFDVVETKLTDLHDKLAAKATTDAEKAKLTDMAAKVADAKTKSSGLVAQLMALQPTDYNANHAVLVNYRASLKVAQTDLQAARDDAKAVIDQLKGGASPSASPKS